jgi:hypothetical protein
MLTITYLHKHTHTHVYLEQVHNMWRFLCKARVENIAELQARACGLDLWQT